MGDLDFGEIAINTYDGKLFIKKDSGTPKIIEFQSVNDWTLKSSNYTVEKGDQIMADTSASAFTITLPATVSLGDKITIIDYDGSWSTNNLTVDGNGHNILSSSSDLICDVDNAKITLIYINATNGWRVFVDTSSVADENNDWAVKTSNYTARHNDKIMADTSSASFLVTLPDNPDTGFEVNIIDYNGTFSTNALNVSGNTENIDGSPSNGTYSIDRAKITFIYTNSTIGWKTYTDADTINGGYF